MTQVRSEDQLGKKWDRCLTDTSIQIVRGAIIGGVVSVLFTSRKLSFKTLSSMPVIFGAGVGVGIGYSNCQHDFKGNLFHGKIQKVEEQ